MGARDQIKEQLTNDLAVPSGPIVRPKASLTEFLYYKNQAQAGDSQQEVDKNLRAVDRNTLDGILIITEKRVYVYANKQIGEVTDYTVAELVKLTSRDLALFGDRDATSSWTQDFGYPLMFEGEKALLIGFQDISGRHPANKEVSRYNDEAVTGWVFRRAKLSIDLGRRRVTRGHREILLTDTEYKLLAYLTAKSGWVVTHNELLQNIWGSAYAGQKHLLQVTVARIRHKIGDSARRPKYIVTIPCRGYMLLEGR
jgi:PAS domain-containing protein